MINGKTILNPTVITGGNIGTTMYKPPVGFEPVHVTITWTGDYLDVSYASVYRMYRNSNRLHRVLSTIVNVGFFQGGGTIEFDIDRSYVSYPTGVVVTRDTEGVAVRGVNVESIDVQIEEEHPISDNTIEAVFDGSRANVRLEYTGSISAEYYLNGEKTIATYSGQTDIFIDTDAQTPIIFKGDITCFKPVPYSGMYPGSGTDVLSIGGSSDVLLKIDAESCEKLNSIDLDGFANIEEINLYECTELSSVDVTANTKLKILSIGSTQVNSLDLSNNTLLEELFIENTNIQSIDLSNNILLETLDIVNTQIQSIDLSLLSSLKIFLCYGSQLQSIDVSSNLQLTQCAVSSCSSMTSVTIGENYDLSSGLSFLLCPSISTVTVRGVSQFIADRIAALIQRNSANAGIVYTNSADPYYSTIKAAALTYNWEVLLLNGWLSETTQNTILTAFGNSDGIAVVEATNDYLDTLNAQDPTKATALAGYISEDPMLVCSLGLEPDGVTMPVRLLQSDGIAYIFTDYHPNQKTEFYIKGEQANTDSALFGNTIIFYCFDNTRRTYMEFDSVAPPTSSLILAGRWAEIRMSKADGVKINGTSVANLSTATDFIANYGMALFGRRIESDGGIGKLGAHKIERAYAKEDGVYVARFAPSIHNGQNGMYDIDAKKWHGNTNTIGSFSMSYLRNGQPWTPPTP